VSSNFFAFDGLEDEESSRWMIVLEVIALE